MRTEDKMAHRLGVLHRTVVRHQGTTYHGVLAVTGHPVVLKVQRPVVSTDPDRPWLLYSEERATKVVMPEAHVSPELLAAMGERHKVYVRATVSAAGGKPSIDAVERVEDQSW